MKTKLHEYRGLAKDMPRRLDVTHDIQPENDVAINPVWCDIGGHQVSEWEIRSIGDTECCEDCFEYFND